ncbi:isoaspartyl peptidase/L-asparaginase family protein [Siansivirga zeaxanthinifaciens]|uniref:Isoaspartyl peptidase n=1 Tax=Siansivirga zeaxanthinifaciens CC-SAMT-1 TaxID=1454006 RepID=A0A0C5WAY0_9FLAO|nr:isoaspartyl peptidase/L-asparaginase [Siansivirga zeaxanthinifaciens]AJR04238.1 isoaspartyl peptidase [Siansivirga zeaxanthinifaciens CC-SAMT-1]
MSKKTKYSLCIHGGAGVIIKNKLSTTDKNLIIADLKASIAAGENILNKGGSATDAVCAAVEVLENSMHFNAGKGAVYNRNGEHLLEASVMDGATLKAGALANSKRIKNPVLFAKTLLNRDDVVFISGDSVDALAGELGHPLVDNNYFDTSFRKEQWEFAQSLSDNTTFLDHTNLKMGTVGAVALDTHGNLAAATSTGGMTNKLDGRIGDSAIIGCGTYAKNKTCAVSCTGIGEFFMRATVASTVSHLMEYGGLSLEAAAHQAIHEHQAKLGGDGGLVAIDAQGNITMPYNSQGMYRAFVNEGSNKRGVFIWDEAEN